MAKKKTHLTDEQRSEYLKRCDEIIRKVFGISLVFEDNIVDMDEVNFKVSGNILLRKDSVFQIALRVIQEPIEREDWSEKHLRIWRNCAASIRIFRENYVKTLILKK